ncbi:MAG: penicillin-binding transpeptidase domain-containing protein [Lachnospiraceae bacterium]|nr:penicillin-binding transpeptidase domain-containing protein [Lachnospiraceae bacterium]
MIERIKEIFSSSPQREPENVRHFTYDMRKKLVFLFFIVLLAFVGLSVRLFMINKENGENYKRKILSQQNYVSTTLPYKRGDILDTNGTKLAYSEKVYNLVVDSSIINSVEGSLEPTLAALDACFDVDINELRNFIVTNKDDRYHVLFKKLEYEEIADFVEMQSNPSEYPNIKGIWFESEYKRVYPYGSLACDTIGFTVGKDIGSFGLEEYYNSILNGTDGREYGYLTDDSDVERTTIPARDGQTIVSTIDANIQSIVDKYVAQWNHEHEGENAYRAGELGSKSTGVIVMDPNNGEVLAMAGYPVFDLNNPRSLSENGLYTEEEIAAMTEEERYDALNQIWRNFCISDTYEPGSTAKSLTISAGLDAGVLTGNESYNCGGVLEVGGHKIHCHKRIGHGTLTLSGALEQSCNVALMQIGSSMGSGTLAEYLSNFNIGLKTNIDLAGEARTDTLVFDPDNMGSADLAISTFGQGYNVTMIQMASAFCSVVNGGYYYQPHVVKEIRNADGSVAEKITPRVLKQTISESTSDKMKGYLFNVCDIGTGKTAVPAGYLIGGKTGTAEMYPRGTGNYVVSFIGFAPVDDPQVVVYVVIDRPNVDHQPHSTFAQEICKNIMTELLPYMQIFRTEEITEEEKEQLRKLGVLSGYPTMIEPDEEEETGEEPIKPADSIQAQIDAATGYAIDPNTGEYLDPETYEPIDPTTSDLGGVGALVDDSLSIHADSTNETENGYSEEDEANMNVD